MKNYISFFCILTLAFTACTKEPSVSKVVNNSKLESREKELSAIEALLRQWTEWGMRIDPATDPGLDTDGSLALQNQPYVPGILFLTGANFENFVERTITVSISDYQKIFYPPIAGFFWNAACDPLDQNNNGKLKPGTMNSQALFNGKDHDLSILWDGNELAPTIPKPLYVNGGFWPTEIHPAYYDYCTLAQPVDMHIEGMVIEIPLTIGSHTLEFKGYISSGKYHQFGFSNHVKYIINVLP